MKKIKIVFVLMLMLVNYSCEETLEIESRNTFTEDFIYSDPDQLESLVFTSYNSTEGWGLNKFMWWSRRFNIEGASFEAKFNFNDLDQYRLRAGWNPNNVGVFRDQWRKYYSYIRDILVFLDKVDDSEAMKINPEKVNLLKAEMKFLLANTYSKLIKYYGGVPLIKNALSLKDDFNISRSSYQDCVDFIVQNLDEAAAVLPLTRPDNEFGRATKLAALAVKSRTLLYAASDLHDPATLPNGPLYDYIADDKWLKAAEAAKAVIDEVGARDLIPVTDAESYGDLFLSANRDIIFARPYGDILFDYGTDVNSLWNQTQAPSGYGGWALSSPTHNFALLYNMNDGTSTSEALYNPAQPNENREMRYYATLNYNGAEFRNREVEYFLSRDTDVHPDGLDSPNGLGNVLHSSKTGYNIRKFQDESKGLTETSPGRPFILYRLAEIYLNYAEANFELGEEDIAREYVNKVSTRALQPAITATGSDLLEAIKRERRIELCFEGHNFFDERRWMNTANLGFDVKGLKWFKETDGSLTNEEITVVTRPWFDRQYYLPIPQSEINKTDSLIQNDGY
ncbi:RagB/SusD family nutrient uptake outer membrane protein [Tenacibaculum sp. M341]|uniref:RagB/SusD family nutrient uptake outer membrane protein n=1 Tax=Tenacibaculum sp. M341 TaxID=2530339 RepID=UPI001043D20F|nr:RagB/SusD family nutrient uptake outer membrane protein [Tenacibaculum sp. M341]TCI90400.1 RagB/SusD family nutrient uptake outer membrane protein [Tenacibaculum sp. M341]